MFEGFARQWTPLLPSGEVTGKPRRLRVAGEDLVVWRPETGGTPGVLLDRCPHRGVSLALGQPTEDGSLACSFHGWEFAPDGVCRHVPFNPDAPTARLGATAVPVREVAGFVWVFTGFDPEGEPNVPEALNDERLTRHDHWEEWDCHWTRAMENMLDFPHLPYIHRTTIGRFVTSKMHRDSRLHMTVTDTAYGFALETRVDEHPPSAALKWYRPHGMVLDTMPEPRVMRLHVWCVPVDADRTRMFLTSARNIVQNPAASLGVNLFNLTVLHQDRAVVESSMPPVVPAGATERSVPTDKPTLTFRTWWLRNLRDSSVPDPRR
jgi:phenylpropionate dioxygenase-like ring-hydroxylating dioxygenase large terminal subunit